MENYTKNEIIAKSAIQQFITLGIPFTSVDITNSLKSTGVWVRNRDVAEYLRKYFNQTSSLEDLFCPTNLNYTSSLIIIHTGDQAFLYHPRSYNPDAYLSRDTKAMTPGQYEDIHGVSPFTEKPKTSCGGNRQCNKESSNNEFITTDDLDAKITIDEDGITISGEEDCVNKIADHIRSVLKDIVDSDFGKNVNEAPIKFKFPM